MGNNSRIDKITIGLFLIIALAVAIILSGSINSFFEGILGENAQASFEAPVVEELLKPLGLLLLAIVSVKKSRLKFLESIEVNYMIGFIIGGLFGFYENYSVYGFFSGFRSATPLLHAFGTGIVAIGIYFMITDGRKGVNKLVLTYIAAVSIHMLWNNVASVGSRIVLAAIAISVTIIGLAMFLYFYFRYQWKDKQSKSPH